MDLKIHGSEKSYFFLRVLFSVIGLLVIGMTASAVLSSRGGAMQVGTIAIIVMYVLIIVLYVWFVNFLMIGHLRGNGVRINANQFPEAYGMMQEIAGTFGMKKMPEVFLLQSGGALNAYATRFVGRNYVAIYSEVFSLVEGEPEVLKFIMAHEFAHVKRHHMQKRFWTFLSFWVPFLGAAYSRSCEYTCDNFGHAVTGPGSRKGLVLLAAGKDLYARVNIDQYLLDSESGNSMATKVAEKFFSHPNLPHRIANIDRV
jgi:Zn-dependent protease with chaperone function